MSITSVTNLDYLIDRLRLHLGDTDATNYRYLDEWLRTALVSAVKDLERWWNFKYLIDTDNNVTRNEHTYTYLFPEPPIISNEDERPIILMSAIIIKGGQLENLSWDFASWRDAEISYSNLESGRSKDKSLDRDWTDLKSYLKPPQSRLAWPRKRSLPGFLNNQYERDGLH
jgi:hypothetical protein